VGRAMTKSEMMSMLATFRTSHKRIRN